MPLANIISHFTLSTISLFFNINHINSYEVSHTISAVIFSWTKASKKKLFLAYIANAAIEINRRHSTVNDKCDFTVLNQLRNVINLPFVSTDNEMNFALFDILVLITITESQQQETEKTVLFVFSDVSLKTLILIPDSYFNNFIKQTNKML